MPRRAVIETASLRSSLVNLPISLYGPLLQRSVRPQHLAVLLTRPSDNAHLYVGWTGMPAASSLQHLARPTDGALETLEIDPQYAHALGLTKGDIVEIGLIHDLPLAKAVATEPLTAGDWEIIETHAALVESTLLSQVRVAKIGQEIDVWVLGRTRVRLRVLSLDPPSKVNALLLTTNTEVSIAPKRRTSSQSTATNSTTTTIPAKLPKKNPPQIVRVLPSRIVRTSLPMTHPSPSAASAHIFAYTSRSTFALLTRSSLSTLSTPPPLDSNSDFESAAAPSTFTYHKCALRRLRPPPDPSPSTVSSPRQTPTTLPHVFHPTEHDRPKDPSTVAATTTTTVGADSTTDATKKHPTHEIYVAWRTGVPEGHLLLDAGLLGSAGEGGSEGVVDEWDLAAIALASTGDDGPALILSHSDWDLARAETQAQPQTEILAGVDDIVTRCTAFCIRKLAMHAPVQAVRGVAGLLLTGLPGAGKTSIVRAVARTLQEDPRAYTYTHYVDMARHAEQPIATLKPLLRYWFDKAAWHRPSILVFDNLEKLLGVELEHVDSFRTRHITELFLALYASSARSAAPNARGVLLLATASSQAALHPLLSTAHVFEEVVNVRPPDKDARKHIVARIVQRRLALASHIQQDPAAPLNYMAIATQTEGYSAEDLQDLVARAMHQMAMRVVRDEEEAATIVLTPGDFTAAQVDFVPLSLRDVKLQKSDVAWFDIGGLHETKRVLRETLEWPTKYGPIFKQSPLRLRSGLLLYGYPGCGKTLLASAVAGECGLNFISVKGPELLNKYIGASEKSVRDLFERASAAKPCVLFFDEFDSIAPKRGHDSTGVTDRVVNQMLTQMDGAEGLDGVYVLAATSRPDLIDSALLRPGRLDKALLCDMPGVKERKEILLAVARKVSVSASVDFDGLARVTDGYSGADLQALVYNAHLQVVHASISSVDRKKPQLMGEEAPSVVYTVVGGKGGQGVISKAEMVALERRLLRIKVAPQGDQAKTRATALEGKEKHEITDEHMRSVLRTTQPSVSPNERARLGRIYRAFVSDRNGDAPVPPDAGGVGIRASLM